MMSNTTKKCETPHVEAREDGEDGSAAPQPQFSRKVFWDPVHGEISLHPVAVSIVDTLEFQRLRHIRQLGLAFYVYPGASHSRFEHSLGTAHLSRLLGSRLRDNQPELNITEKELLCLEVAGLCHDLGHGPFSHIWERFYRSGAKRRGEEPAWTHEDMSCKVLDHLIQVNELQHFWKKHLEQELTEDNLTLIKNLIIAKVDGEVPSRRFLFQIVNNRDSGLDVDKWDYYLRDCHAVGVKCGFQYERLVSSARVVEDQNGVSHIAFRDKEVANVYEMFRTRSRLHYTVYRHPFVGIVEAMIGDALRLADESKSHPLGLWEKTHKVAHPTCGKDEVEAFLSLTDCSVEQLVRCAHSKGDDVLQPRRIWNAVECRFRKPDQLYHFLGSVPHKDGLTEDNLPTAFVEALPEEVRPLPKDLIAIPESVHWGRDHEDPVSKVWFYRKSRPQVAVRADDLRPLGSAFFLPSQFEDRRLHLFLREPPHLDLARHLENAIQSLPFSTRSQVAAVGDDDCDNDLVTE